MDDTDIDTDVGTDTDVDTDTDTDTEAGTDADTDADTVAMVMDTGDGALSASALAGEMGGLRCDSTGSAPFGLAGAVMVALVMRRLWRARC